MDRDLAVEAFRSMIVQKGVVSPDGSEDLLTELLSSDMSAVEHFHVHYLSQPNGWEEKAIRSAYSALERGQMLSKDLVILTLWGTYVESFRFAHGYKPALIKVQSFGFMCFRRLDYQEMREMVSTVRSKATAHFFTQRNELTKLCALLKRRNDRIKSM